VIGVIIARDDRWGVTPVVLVSTRADRAVVETLLRRLG